ncbi:hypothetical protein WJX72_011517 [[Myrmecia] bisecta]|uniref:Uncharacterized protein n=1 Tax=[Myrmecia] bisecta TaxID=41462 RepID=A0AAW1QGP6_9CHLO
MNLQPGQQLVALVRHFANAAKRNRNPPIPLSTALTQLEALVTSPEVRKNAEATKLNHLSLHQLQTFLHTFLTTEGRPPASRQQLTFVVKDPDTAGLRTVGCTLRSTGGYCQPLVEDALSTLLADCGLPATYFDDRMAAHSSSTSPTEPMSKRKLAAVRAQAAAAGYPSQAVSEEELNQAEAKLAASRIHVPGSVGAGGDQPAALQSNSSEQEEASTSGGEDGPPDVEDELLRGNLKRLDPLLAAVAAVPWMGTEDGRERANFIQKNVLDELEAQGWDLRGGVQRIWQGERDIDQLSQRLDIGSRAALSGILFHTAKIEEQHGPPTRTGLSEKQ